MSTITYHGHVGPRARDTSTKVSAGLRALLCASAAVAITSLTAQVIGSAANVSQPGPTVAAVLLPAAAPLPAVPVIAAS